MGMLSNLMDGKYTMVGQSAIIGNGLFDYDPERERYFQ